ncbi:MAG: DUF4377 domain-containing protein [Moraxella sp.]|nr:DUF4377 domain-containing protein [Moraxella sp.]
MKYLSLGAVLTGILVLTACQSTPQPAPRYVADISLGEPQTLSVQPYRATCDSKQPMQCLIITHAGASESFGVAYNAIDGFEPKIGTSYKIIARPQIDQNNSNATGKWTLVEILSQN